MSARRYSVEIELDTGWMTDAACTAMPGLPWIENHKRVPRVLVELMAETCRTCPVLAQCEEFVDQAEVTAGWWAGSTRSDRNVQTYGPTGYARLSAPGQDDADADEDVEGAA